MSVRYLRTFLTITFFFVFVPCTWGQPVITSFSPTSGPVGTTVTITGSNFSTTPANNIVYFGAVKANVTAAAAGSLTVIVPAGATHQPITVTVNNLTALSSRPFTVSFSGGILSPASFTYELGTDNVTGIETNDLTAGDFDNDGKNDVAVIDRLNNFMAVYKNTSTTATFSFLPRIDYATGTNPRGIASGDFDGDGKLDIVVANADANSVSVYRNTSTTGTISFAPKVDFATATQPLDVAVADFDGDGRIDIAVVNGGLVPSLVSVLRNTGTGTLAFAPRTDITIPIAVTNLAVGDLNSDNKPDIVSVSLPANVMTILTNGSTPGTVSFPTVENSPTGTGPDGLMVGDIDGDNKPDIAYANFFDQTVFIYRNTSSGAAITLGTPQNLALPGADRVTLADADGDAKPDVIVQTFSPSGFSVLKNNSSPGSITLGAAVATPASCSEGVIVGDWNNDGRCDVALGCGIFRVGIWKNRTTEPQITSFSPVSAISGTTVTINGVNLSGVNSVSFGGTPAASFTVVNGTTVTAVVGTGASGAITVTAPYGSGSKDGFTFYPAPTISSFNPTSAANGTTVTITGTNFIAPVSVMFGGTAATSVNLVNSTTITAVVGTGASGNVSVTTPGGTANMPGFTHISATITSFSPTSGGPGTIVTINGSNFNLVSGVSFGGVPAASYSPISSTQVNATVANGASGNVAVSTLNNGTAIAPGFTYTGPIITSFNPTSGNTGTTITITGQNLTGATAVSFGGTPASSFVVVNATTITAVVAGGTTGIVSVTTPVATATLAGFTYTGSPVVTSFTPAAAGAGGLVTISGNHFTGTTAVSFGGVAAQSFTVVNANTITAIVGAGGATGNVAVTNPNGTGSLAGFTFMPGPGPSITSFSPVSGPAGTTITITGQGFSTTPANNIVYFGPVRGSVTAASATSLTVMVPAGAVNEPIFVTVNGYTGYSRKPFILTFANNGITAFSSSSFAPRVNFAIDAGLRHSIAGDFDNDGKADIAVVNQNQLGFSVIRNTSTPGNLSFVLPVHFSTGVQNYGINVADIDGDGKQDVLAGNGSAAVSVFRNTSSGSGVITFAPKKDIPSGSGPFYIDTDDIDGDGRPDIITANSFGSSVSVIRNTSGAGTITFATKVDLNISNNAIKVVTADIDGDGKPDIIVSKGNPSQILILRNTSSPGLISFAPALEFATGQNPMGLVAADFDGDDKPDIVTANYSSANATILKNTSVSGSVSFIASTFNTNVGSADHISAGDINGDGKIDLAFTNFTFVSVFENTSAGGNISFNSKFEYPMTGSTNVNIGDLDNDGKPDLASQNNLNGNFESVLRSTVGLFGISSFTPAAGGTGTVITITGVNLSGATAVSFGGTTASSFTVVNATTITAVVGDGASGNVSITTPAGTTTLGGFVFVPAPVIGSFSPQTATAGTIVTISGSNLTGATAISFGGVAASSFTVVNATTITAVVGAGATGIISVTTPGGTATKSGFTYSTVTAVIDPSAVNSAELTVAPNPGDDIILIKHPSSAKGATLQFYDVTGRNIMEINVGRSVVQTEVNVNSLSPAVYYILWNDEKRKLTRVFMVK